MLNRVRTKNDLWFNNLQGCVYCCLHHFGQFRNLWGTTKVVTDSGWLFATTKEGKQYQKWNFLWIWEQFINWVWTEDSPSASKNPALLKADWREALESSNGQRPSFGARKAPDWDRKVWLVLLASDVLQSKMLRSDSDNSKKVSVRCSALVSVSFCLQLLL